MKYLIAILLLFMTGVANAEVFGPSDEICWVPPPGAVTGYNVYFGVASRQYGEPIDIGARAKPDPAHPGSVCVKISDIGVIPKGLTYVVVNAYNATGESPVSNELVFDFSLVAATTTTTIKATTTTTTTSSTSTTRPPTTTTLPPTGGISFFTPTQAPALIDTGALTQVELGVRFTTDVPGALTAIRLYKAPLNIGPHTVSLWANRARIATATSISETELGWQQVNFIPPVALSANTVYTASYRDTKGHFSVDHAYPFGNVSALPLRIIPNGVFTYGPPGTFPAEFTSSNYWVDVVFASSTPTSKLVSIAVGPQAITITTQQTVQFSATGTYADGSSLDLTNQVAWSAQDQGEILVITATLGSVSGSTALKVVVSPTGRISAGGMVSGGLK